MLLLFIVSWRNHFLRRSDIPRMPFCAWGKLGQGGGWESKVDLYIKISGPTAHTQVSELLTLLSLLSPIQHVKNTLSLIASPGKRHLLHRAIWKVNRCKHCPRQYLTFSKLSLSTLAVIINYYSIIIALIIIIIIQGFLVTLKDFRDWSGLTKLNNVFEEK